MSRGAVGIHLGNTKSCMAIYANKKLEIIENELGQQLTPSVVSFTEQKPKKLQSRPTTTICVCRQLYEQLADENNRKRSANDIKGYGDNGHFAKKRGAGVGSISTSSTTSFCSCSNGTKPAISANKIDAPKAVPLSISNLRNEGPVSKKHVSLGCQTNLGKEITIELAVYHGGRKVVSENFDFPNSTVTDKTITSGKSFEIYCEIVNQRMLQVWGVEKDAENKQESHFGAAPIRQNIHQMKLEKENVLENFPCEKEAEKMQALLYWTKSQTAKCKSIILEKYDEIWEMLDRVTNEALNELVAKEKELMKLFEEATEFEIKVTDYKDILSNAK